MDFYHLQQLNIRLMTWSKPHEGQLKINIDAVVFQDDYVGIGAVIRDSKEQFVHARCNCLIGKWKPRETDWVKGLSLDFCRFETDSILLVEACKGDDGVSYFHTIVLDCIDLCKHFDHVLVQYMHRSANGVAHLLSTHSMSSLREWANNPLEFIQNVLNSDII